MTHLRPLAEVVSQSLVDFLCRRHPGLEQAAGGFWIRVCESIGVRGARERLHGGCMLRVSVYGSIAVFSVVVASNGWSSSKLDFAAVIYKISSTTYYCMKTAALIRRTAALRQRACTQHIANTAPASRPYHTSPKASSSSASSSFLESSNAAIKQAFDAPPPVFSLLESFQSTSPSAGRFGYDALRNPEDFVELSRRTQRRAEAIVSRILDYAQSTTPLDAAGQHHASSSSTSITYSRSHEDQVHDLLVQVKQVDRLSDLLCSVIDLAELVRNLDPNPDWIKHAETAYQELCYYMNQLNTHVELYRVSFS